MYEINLNEIFAKVYIGDKEAFSLIYNELKQPIFTIAYRIVQSRELAEDITQDVFVKLFTSPPDSSVKNPRAWIFQMTRNQAIDALRKKQCVELEEDSIPASDSYAQLIERLDIEKAFSKLALEERELLSLRLTAELGFADIAHIMGLSITTVFRNYKKALKHLQELLSGGGI